MIANHPLRYNASRADYINLLRILKHSPYIGLRQLPLCELMDCMLRQYGIGKMHIPIRYAIKRPLSKRLSRLWVYCRCYDLSPAGAISGPEPPRPPLSSFDDFFSRGGPPAAASIGGSA